MLKAKARTFLAPYPSRLDLPDRQSVERAPSLAVTTRRTKEARMGEQRGSSERAARNQSLYRAVNERVKEINEAFDDLGSLGDWICECANPECTEPVPLTHEEYEAVRTRPTCFLVLPDAAHVLVDVENVIERHERYWVVEKTGAAAELAERRAGLQATHSD